jgi:hypothetical protein
MIPKRLLEWLGRGSEAHLEMILDPRLVNILDAVYNRASREGDDALIRIGMRRDRPDHHREANLKFVVLRKPGGWEIEVSLVDSRV